MSTRPLEIMYVGPGLSGRTTSLASVLSRLGQPADPAQIRDIDPTFPGPKRSRFVLPVDDGVQEVIASVSWVRGWLWYEDPLDPQLDPRITAEIDAAAACDGFVFVVDPRQQRVEASLEAFERLAKDLESRDRTIDSYPIVFQTNLQDLSGGLPLEWVHKNFSVKCCAFTESIAKQGIGTMEAASELVRLITAA